MEKFKELFRGLFEKKKEITVRVVGNIKLTKIENENINKQQLFYVPSNFSEYIGQRKVKNILKNYIKSTKKRKSIFPHTLIHGKAGMGKTTLAKIIAKELGKGLVEVISSSLPKNENILQEKIKTLNGRILFIDEIHSLPRNEAETIYSMMENFSLNGISVSPFTLIGATTEIGEILKTRRPFYERFKLPLELEDYTINNLIKIVENYREKLFPDDDLDIEHYKILAQNCRLTPRIAIKLTESLIYFNKNIKEVFNNFGIIIKGYTKKDFKLLEYLSKNKVVGLQGIASYLDTSQENYLYEIEPYLIKTGLIVRTPRGRNISDYGRKLLKQMKGKV